MTERDIAKMIDHTFLKPDGPEDAVEKLCAEAKERSFASVCVNPCETARAAELLAGSGVEVCTVVGFPLGQNTTATKIFEAREAIENGAGELDFVINVRLLKYAPEKCLEELKALARASKQAKSGVTIKLIIECCLLDDREKRLACRLAEEAGFDFVKTSTGFSTGGATAADVRLMRETVGGRLRVKAAGGIRTLESALEMISAGADRLGCSAGIGILDTIKKGKQ